MSDIIIVKGAYLSKALVAGMTDRGRHWIWNNMEGPQPITIEKEHVDEITKMIEADGLTVVER